jgi:phage tail protein X
MGPLNRIIVLLCACLLLTACTETSEESSLQQIDRAALEPPLGVLLIVIDTLRADHLGIYDPDRPYSPALDAFAREAVVFDAAYAASPWTRSSIASIFTGRHPTEIDVQTKKDLLVGEVLTLAEVFRENGFDTHGINTNGNVNAIYGFDQGFDFYGPPPGSNPEPVDGEVLFPASEVTSALLERLGVQSADTPLFAYALYIDPHDPYYAYPELMSRPEPAGQYDGAVWSELRALDALAASERTELDEDRIRYLYESEVRYTDLWLGKLFEGLKELGLYDRYVIAVTSDHGEELWDHGQRPHGTSLYEELVRVPLIIRFPPSWGVQASRVATPVGHVDIAPTLVAAAGITVPGDFAGLDLWDEAEGYYQPLEGRLAYTEMLRRGLDLEAVSTGTEKLIHDRDPDETKLRNRRHLVAGNDTLRSISFRYFGDRDHMDEIIAVNPGLAGQGVRPMELELPVGQELAIPDPAPEHQQEPWHYFDLVTDPGERQDLFDSSSARQQDLVGQFEVMSAGIERRRQVGGTIEDAELDEETLKQLQGLGYIQGGD